MLGMCMYHDVLESDVQSAAQDPHGSSEEKNLPYPREYCRRHTQQPYLCVFPADVVEAYTAVHTCAYSPEGIPLR